MGFRDEWDKALHSQLANDATLAAAVTGVYTGIAPQATDSGDPSAFPYVVIGDTEAAPYHTGTETGFEIYTTIYTVSRSPGRRETRQLQDMVQDALHRQQSSLSVVGHSVLLIDCEGTLVEEPVDADGSWIGSCEYRALVTRNAAD